MTATVFEPEAVFTGGRLVRGALLAVSAEGRVLAEAPSDALKVPLPGRAMFPGLVNAHSHAFQRVLRGRTEYVAAGKASDDFWSWREAMYAAATGLSPEGVYTASRQAFVEMALAGITTVGEFHYLHHQADGTPYADVHELSRQVVRAAREVGLRIVLLRVGYARAGYQVAPNPRQARFLDPDVETYLARGRELAQIFADDPHVTVGLAPHSVRAVPRAWLEAIARAVPSGVVHLHVAEQPAEVRACQAEHGRTPVELLDEVGLLRERTTAVHGIHLSPGDVALLGKARATVCACPTTEANLGDGVVPADLLLKAGVRLSLGSDSQATIDLLTEARLVESHLRLLRQRRAVLDEGSGRPGAPAERLLQMLTVDGAHCLGLAGQALLPGEPADFFTVDLAHPSMVGVPEEAVAFAASGGAVREVAVQGQFIVRDGRHRLSEQSGAGFQRLVNGLTA